MGLLGIGATAASFGRDLAFDTDRIAALIDHARRSGAGLLVLPDAALGGYLEDLRHPDPAALPPALALDDGYVRKVASLAASQNPKQTTISAARLATLRT
jgi:predicted amidohydrolase